jgi:hypothetical protein
MGNGRKPSVEIAIPVYYNNLLEIEESVSKQIEFFSKTLTDFNWKIVIAINGKNAEKIINKSKELSKAYKNVAYIYTPNPGKGHGVLSAWKSSNADIMSYMDVDLATDIKDFKNLIEKIVKGYDVSVGSRYHKKSKVHRKLIRVFISRVYQIFFLKLFMGAKYKDAQCGFKAVNKKVVKEVLPLIKDGNWFFESEMMFIAQKKGLKIVEIPVVWSETWRSTIQNFTKVILDFILKSIELRFRKL